MNTATVSSKYQLVIPKEIRIQAGIHVGTNFEVLVYENRIELIPIEPIKNLKGFLKGINTEIRREEDR